MVNEQFTWTLKLPQKWVPSKRDEPMRQELLLRLGGWLRLGLRRLRLLHHLRSLLGNPSQPTAGRVASRIRPKAWHYYYYVFFYYGREMAGRTKGKRRKGK